MAAHDRTSAPVQSPRIRIRRVPKRAVYDRPSIYAAIDAGFLCHVGYVFNEQPYVTPTTYWREGDRLYWHGSSASRMLKTLAKGVAVCVTVTHVDGLVLARSGFNHTVNYRSVMAFGVARPIAPADKLAALEAFMNRLFPGRWAETRQPTEQELKATTIMSMVIDEVSAKIRNAPPPIDDVDKDIACWSGVIPLHLTPQAPIAADDVVRGTPAYATDLASRFALAVGYPPNV